MFSLIYPSTYPRPSGTRPLVRGKALQSIEFFMDRPPVEPTVRSDDQQSECWMTWDCTEGCCNSWRQKENVGDNRDEFFCFRLFSWRDMDDYPSKELHDAEIWFLVLKKSSKTQGAYERIGVGFWTFGIHQRKAGVPWAERNGVCRLFEDAESKTINIV